MVSLVKSSSVLIARTSLAVLVLLFAAHANAHAAVLSAVGAPEIDPSLSMGGLALLGGVILLVRGRRK
jgi:hypothetical protein